LFGGGGGVAGGGAGGGALTSANPLALGGPLNTGTSLLESIGAAAPSSAPAVGPQLFTPANPLAAGGPLNPGTSFVDSIGGSLGKPSLWDTVKPYAKDAALFLGEQALGKAGSGGGGTNPVPPGSVNTSIGQGRQQSASPEDQMNALLASLFGGRA